MADNLKKIQQLLQKFDEGKLNEAEKEVLDQWLDSVHFEDVPSLTEGEFEDEEFFQKQYQDIIHRASAKKKPARVIPFRLKAIAAAVVIILATIVWNQLYTNRSANETASNKNIIDDVNDIEPGYEGAILSLGDGKEILLDSAKQGQIASQGHTLIDNKNGMLSYKTATDAAEEILTNTLTTPIGREYRLQLPDGSNVWLNASSSITFPTKFSDKERRVQLQGEAFFEVAKTSRNDGSRIPFFVDVISGSGTENTVSMEVLGTSFNVNAYSNEADIRTTLLEGSVRVHAAGKSEMLSPSRQAVITPDGNTRITSDVNIDQVIAWRKGLFYFDHTDIHTILRQFSRWYGIEIIAVNSNTSRTFTGKINRNIKLADVLKIMDLSNIRYTIEDGKMIINGIVSK